MLGWTLWLLHGFAANVIIDRHVIGTPGTIHWVFMWAMVGMWLIWPTMRLSQAAPARSTLATLCDLFILVTLLQLVIVPARVSSDQWPMTSVLVMDMAFIVYGLVVAMVIDHGRRSGPIGRVLAMGVLLTIAVFGFSLSSDTPMTTKVLLAPLRAFYVLSDPQAGALREPVTGTLFALGLVVVMAWSVSLWVRRRLAKP